MRRDTDGHDVVWLTPDRRRSSQGMQTSGTHRYFWQGAQPETLDFLNALGIRTVVP
jgi:hypothetical protein